MRFQTFGCAAAALLSTGAAAAPLQQMSKNEFVAAVDRCLAANEQSEFDGPQQVLAKVKASCDVTATVRFAARGHPILGNIIRYDPAAQAFVWNSTLDDQNRFYGGGASPYRLAGTPTGQLAAAGATPQMQATLREVSNASFWLLPIYRTAEAQSTYEASNAYGATRTVQKVTETRYGIAAHVPKSLTTLRVLEAPMSPAKAKQVADSIDIALTFAVGEVCPICYKANTLERGSKPTIHTPVETEVTTRFVYANILRIDLIDRTTGEALFASVPAPN